MELYPVGCSFIRYSKLRWRRSLLIMNTLSAAAGGEEDDLCGDDRDPAGGTRGSLLSTWRPEILSRGSPTL